MLLKFDYRILALMKSFWKFFFHIFFLFDFNKHNAIIFAVKSFVFDEDGRLFDNFVDLNKLKNESEAQIANNFNFKFFLTTILLTLL